MLNKCQRPWWKDNKDDNTISVVQYKDASMAFVNLPSIFSTELSIYSNTVLVIDVKAYKWEAIHIGKSKIVLAHTTHKAVLLLRMTPWQYTTTLFHQRQ